MRLPLIMALIATAAPAASAGPELAGDMPVFNPSPLKADSRECPPISRYHAMKRGERLKGQKLTELPMADTYAAAYRRIGGCEAPIMIRYGVDSQRSR